MLAYEYLQNTYVELFKTMKYFFNFDITEVPFFW